MNKDNILSISLMPTHGTARHSAIASILPNNKADIERFWVEQLLQKIPIESKKYKVFSNPDDSNGQSDVIIDFDGIETGVQVTELTYELERYRISVKEKYVAKIIEELLTAKIKSKDRLLISIIFPYTPAKKPTKENAKSIAKVIIKEVGKFTSDIYISSCLLGNCQFIK